jgi:hypothetical protein
MSKPTTVSPSEFELAERIYIDLVARNATVADGGVKMAVSAENLAKLSFKLAEAFLAVEAALQASAAPVTNYKLGADDVASWMK